MISIFYFWVCIASVREHLGGVDDWRVQRIYLVQGNYNTIPTHEFPFHSVRLARYTEPPHGYLGLAGN
jgi:hypothetical protein